MKVNHKTVLNYVIMSLACLLAVFFFFRNIKLSNQVKAMTSEAQVFSEYKEMKQTLDNLDGLMLSGDYIQAMSSYESLDSGYKKYFENDIQWRLSLSREFLKLTSNTIDNIEIVEVDSVIREVTHEVEALPEEVRKYDSLNFVLKKAYARIKYLNKQLENRKNGGYLNFTTSKGKELYYAGEVKDNMANGQGVAILISGSRYKGEWKDNMRHGDGEFHWPDGQYYVGAYRNDKRHGVGTYYWPNGDKYIGEWEDDHRNGEGTFYGKDEQVVSGTWKKDKLVEVNKKD